MLITYKFRVRDTATSELNRQARAVNFVWNYCNERQKEAAKNIAARGLASLAEGAYHV